MFIYDPQRDISQWVPIQGVCTSLTMVELRSANDFNNMNPCLYDGTELVQPHSAILVTGIPTEAESDTDSLDEHDSGEEWDKRECGDWWCCPSLPPREGPMWAEATAEHEEKSVGRRMPPHGMISSAAHSKRRILKKRIPTGTWIPAFLWSPSLKMLPWQQKQTWILWKNPLQKHHQ